jgi:hypothetical protein
MLTPMVKGRRKQNRKIKKKFKKKSQVPAAHTCNPSYSGGRDQDN